MHVLGHGFGSRRKSSPRRPRDLHIRKVSFSGSSLSGDSISGCSLSSSTSSTPTATPTVRTPTTAAVRPDMDPLHLNPLNLNPAFHAPPRLFERAFKDTTTLPVFDEEDTEDNVVVERHVPEQQPAEQIPTPHVSPMDNPGHDRQQSRDSFFAVLAKRPAMPLSRWSESTVQTLDFEVTQDEDSSDEEEDQPVFEDSDDSDVLEMRRLSRRISRRSSARADALQTLSLNITYNKRPTLQKRPPMRSLDTVDNFIRRGGWKRRGIVFRAEDMDGTARPAERASY
ncbi:hypothetical protein AK830_g12659 [Neonectria ditissima]|uniref:Uncharacterized protein n=1 Tax=Neonectria ditissima TaxID=78410 RepID=A0A0P7B304_9HYPO|nr:hypothetical protein AK830_g12659 [Neonectria ditissima]